MQRAHKIRMYPSEKQVTQLAKTAGTCRFAYNWAIDRAAEMLEARKADSSQPYPTAFVLKKLWNSEKPEWAREVNCASPNEAILHYGKAQKNFFAGRAERPKRKKKSYRSSFYVPNDKASLKGTRIRLPNIGWIRLAEPLRFEGKIMSYSVSGYAGQWHVSVHVEMPDAPRPCIDLTSTVGIDVGLKNPAVASDGTKIELPASLKKLKAKLRRAERALARSQKASNNRKKLLKRKQKLELKQSNIRQDVAHKFTTTVCKNHATVVIEDLNIEGMKEKATYRSFRRAFNESLMTTILYQLEYKAVNLIKAPRFYPSTKLCSACGSIKDAMPPSVRTYECEHCGAVIDRDLNAALNLMKLGLVKPE